MGRFKHVKFSRSTAKNNPSMIIREYKRIIDELGDSISKIYVDRKSINIEITDRGISRDIAYEILRHPSPWEHKLFSIKLNYIQIEHLYNLMTGMYKKELELRDTLNDIKEELDRFRIKYM